MITIFGVMNRVKHLQSARFGFAGMLAACLAFGAVSGCGQHQDTKVKSSRYSALGEVMASKLNEMAGGKGRIVLLVAENDNNHETAFGQTIAAFRKAVSQSFQMNLETVATPTVIFPGSEPFPADKFAALLQKHADADYVVSFVGVPALTPAQIDQLPSPRPQVVEVVTFNPPTKAMFAKKVVCLAVVPRPASDQAATGRTSQEMFDALYQVVMTETASILTH
jgi:hypothetical protein